MKKPSLQELMYEPTSGNTDEQIDNESIDEKLNKMVTVLDIDTEDRPELFRNLLTEEERIKNFKFMFDIFEDTIPWSNDSRFADRWFKDLLNDDELYNEMIEFCQKYGRDLFSFYIEYRVMRRERDSIPSPEPVSNPGYNNHGAITNTPIVKVDENMPTIIPVQTNMIHPGMSIREANAIIATGNYTIWENPKDKR